jgi:chromodomain-helicase-DNA-binding protein 4
MMIIEKDTVEFYHPASFQNEDLAYLEDLDYSANWSEMGTYKTTTGLWLAERKLKDVENPALLIITTKMGKGTYFDAIPKTLPSWAFINMDARKITRIEFGGELRLSVTPEEFANTVVGPAPTVVLAHYNNFTNKAAMRPLLMSFRWDGLIVDEAHRLKNRDGQWVRWIKKIKADFRHIMTGTGFINRPDELWSLLNFLDRKEYSSFWNFFEEFCEIEVDWGTGFQRVSGIKPEKIDEFRDLRKSLGPRRMLNEVRPDIDEPIYTPINVELNPVQREMYNEIRDDLYTLDQQGTPIYSPNVLSQLNRLRQICVATPEKVEEYYDEQLERVVQKIRLVEPSSKLDAVMELIDNMEWDDEHKQQLVVFSSFKDPLHLLEERLKKANIPYLRLLQEHNEQKRYELWHDEWPKKEHRVFLTTLSLGGESINLTSAQHAVFLDRSWSPKDNAQAIGRVYRPGQTGQTQIININAIDTTDQLIEERVNIKMAWFKLIFG